MNIDSHTSHHAGWRHVPANSANHWFHRATGLHAVERNETTRHYEPLAPRTVMFGITNACNLQCGFCSRELAAQSDWTVDSAAALLCDLSARGVLEVAYGGGEPFAFKRFDALLERVATQSQLAQNITTNGVLLDDALAERIAPWVGQVRQSVYDDIDWRRSVACLVHAGIETGVNLIVTPHNLGILQTLLAMMRDAGCHDVALLRYVGPELHMHLTRAQQAELATVAMLSPLPVKLSVCFGEGLAVPLLATEGGDCGAGDSFVSITSDRRMRACSFHESLDDVVCSAEDVIRLWRSSRQTLLLPSARPGCARAEPSHFAESGGTRELEPSIQLWQGYSGNNSGECIHVARFSTAQNASDALTVLKEGMQPGKSYAPALIALFEELRIPMRTHIEPENKELQTPRRIDYLSEYPDVLIQAGHVVVATTDWALHDVFPEIRAYLWKRGGVATYATEHEHSRVDIVAAFHSNSSDALTTIAAALHLDRECETAIRVQTLQAIIPRKDLTQDIAWLQALAAENKASFSMELAQIDSNDAAIALKEASLLKQPIRQPAYASEGMFVVFDSREQAAAFGKAVKDAHIVDRFAWIQAERVGPRLGYIAARYDGVARWMSGPFAVSAWWTDPDFDSYRSSHKRKKVFDPEHLKMLQQAWRPFAKGAALEAVLKYERSAYLSLATTNPVELMCAAAEGAAQRKLHLYLSVSSQGSDAAHALKRVSRDVIKIRGL
jgi:MoaA/NifB/PqqE/SkfB family radical SAM enzyme